MVDVFVGDQGVVHGAHLTLRQAGYPVRTRSETDVGVEFATGISVPAAIGERRTPLSCIPLELVEIFDYHVIGDDDLERRRLAEIP